MSERVNHPHHYNFGGPKEADGTAKYEVIKVIEDWGLGFKLGNAVKYIARAGHKDNRAEDLKKARWYLARAVEKPTNESLPWSEIERELSTDDVIAAWMLSGTLAETIRQISDGAPSAALSCLDSYLAREASR